jgi:hypothetical protein
VPLPVEHLTDIVFNFEQSSATMPGKAETITGLSVWSAEHPPSAQVTMPRRGRGVIQRLVADYRHRTKDPTSEGFRREHPGFSRAQVREFFTGTRSRGRPRIK